MTREDKEYNAKIKNERKIYWKKNFIDDYESKNKNDLGEGGNATVIRVTLINNTQVAYKELAEKHLTNEKSRKEKIQRFKDEIETMNKLKSERGVMPILDFSVDGLCYTMPIAESLKDYFAPILLEAQKEAKKEDEENDYSEIVGVEKKQLTYVKAVVNCILEVITTLSKIHELGYSHRDIKLENLYFLDNHFVIGDFGLVDFPTKTNITTTERDLGAHFTIAPEMKRNPDTADGKIADVYSLAKTFWMLLTKNDESFEGQYNFLDKKHNLSEYRHLKYIHLPELHEILKKATTNAPEERATLSEFKNLLEQWLKVVDNFHLQSISKWKFVNNFLFNGTTPQTTIWTKIEDIKNILIFLSQFTNYFNIAGPAGWIDFNSVNKANEEGCLYLQQRDIPNKAIIIKPKQLIFETFENDISWNYFMLELEKMDFIHSNSENKVEELVEDYPAQYVYVNNPIYGVYDYEKGNKFPDGYKIVDRYFDGNFLFYLKAHTDDNIFDSTLLKTNQNPFRIFRECVEKKMKGDDISQYIIAPDNYEEHKSEEQNEMNVITIGALSDNKNDLPQRIVLPHIQPANNNSKLKFMFATHKGLNSFIEKLTHCVYLLNDGSFCKHKRNGSSPDNILVAYNENDANIIQKSVSEKLKDRIDIIIKRIAKPTHLFTEDELKNVMIQADDRVSHTFVIDGDGFVKLIDNSENRDLYPVYSHAITGCGKYFGKYMVSSDRFIHENYVDLLLAWYLHLTKDRQVDDHTVNASGYWFDNDKLNELIQKIKKFY